MMRMATAEDAPALSRLHAGGFREGWTPDDLATWLSRREAMVVVAEEGGEPVGFGLALAAGDDAELLTIAVSPSRRVMGWGRKILQALDVDAARRGLERWVLEVSRTNVAAIALYKSEGFVEIGLRKAYYPEEHGRVDALVMCRGVGRAGGQNNA